MTKPQLSQAEALFCHIVLVTMDFAFFSINLKINKMASLSILKISNYPQMTFLFYKILKINMLCFKI